MMLPNPMMKLLMLYILPFVSAFIGIWWPAALQLSFFTASLLSLGQATLFRNAGFRKLMKMAPLPKLTNPVSGATTAYSGTLTRAGAIAAPVPTNASPSSLLSRPGNMIRGAVTDMRNVRTEAMKSLNSLTGAEPTAPGKRSKAEKRRADAYEERRSREEAEKRRGGRRPKR